MKKSFKIESEELKNISEKRLILGFSKAFKNTHFTSSLISLKKVLKWRKLKKVFVPIEEIEVKYPDPEIIDINVKKSPFTKMYESIKIFFNRIKMKRLPAPTVDTYEKTSSAQIARDRLVNAGIGKNRIIPVELSKEGRKIITAGKVINNIDKLNNMTVENVIEDNMKKKI